MVKRTDIKQRILDSALKLAEERSWEEIHLRDIATDLDISLSEIQQNFRQKDDLVEAWFDRADQAILQLSPEELGEMKLTDRLHMIIFTWLDTLAEHKTITREMLWYKLEPLHIHLQIQGLLRISRTVQWMQELAGLKAQYIKRITEEIGLTSIYLSHARSGETVSPALQKRLDTLLESIVTNAPSPSALTRLPRWSSLPWPPSGKVAG